VHDPGSLASMAPRVRLRDVDEEDLPTFFEHQRDPEGTRMAALEPRDQAAFTAHWSRILADDTVVVRTVLADGEVAGNVVSWNQDGEWLVGYWIGREHWGRGIATEALEALVQLLEVRPLVAHVAVTNVGSIRVLEKCGFTRTSEHTADDGVRELLFELRE
jgi:RimJ/RimL family protein N-acetyltransferase